MNNSKNCDKANLARLFLRPFKRSRNAFGHEFRRQKYFTGKNGSDLDYELENQSENRSKRTFVLRLTSQTTLFLSAICSLNAMKCV